MKRKEFIQTSMRLLIAGGIAALGTYSIIKRSNSEDCMENRFCERCSKYDGCTLPQALKQRRNGEG
ncbi:MAG: hypothetical protein MI922_05250 [Bacteroidales bacterium]|nr:hypothetical protein [Bacteroidales bacterium]